MKILFAGGGTGGHFYPIIAIAEEVNTLIEKEHLTDIELYFMSDSPIDKELLEKTGIKYIEVKTGKRRTYFSILNFLDVFRTFFASMNALWKIFVLYPDVIFGKGGYASFPAMFAAKILRIPVVIHESDIIPGKVNKYIADYATKVAISYPDAVKYFKNKDRIAQTGQPVRRMLLDTPKEDPYETFKLEPNVPIILVLGGSQGSERINENVIDILTRLVEKYQILHQTGETNLDWMKKRAAGVLLDNPNSGRYRPFGFLPVQQLAIAAKGATLIISRAGSTIFEISIWHKPSILIPLQIARDDHQKLNAYSYARTGAATVIEEQNLKQEVFFSVIESIMTDPARQQLMIKGTNEFGKPDAAEKIAQLLLSIATHHD
jgi:UDP-N-acetylglucosamine--N-acetylmuramyl-(pentapeptide) pyrophosphoryl-undecaprenol N-acetylglucosamine transferase